MESSLLNIRPRVTNKELWYPERPPKAQWDRIRKIVLERDNWTCAGCGHQARKFMNLHHLTNPHDNSPENLVTICVACHAVLHVGRNLALRRIEIWESAISQVEIIRKTRSGVEQGMTLDQTKRSLPLRPGSHPPNSVEYANEILRSMSDAPYAELPEPLCAIFVRFKQWQI